MAVTTVPAASIRASLLPVGALLVSVAFLFAGHGLQQTLVPLRAEAEGFSDVAIGLLGASFFVGFVLGCIAGPRIILRAGHIRSFAAMVSLGSAAAIVFPLAIDPIVWDLCRLIVGFCLSGLYIIIESWLNEKSSNATRGVVMSTYTVLALGMITVGQLIVTTVAIEGFALFAIASILFSVAAVPVALTRSSQPAPIPVVRFRPWRLYGIAPAGFAAALLIGIANGAFWGLGPLFATGRGLSIDEAAIFMSVAVVAGAIAQYPLGRASDFVDRRKVLVVAMLGAASGGLLLWQLSDLGPIALFAFGALFGAFTLPSYSLAAAHAYDWAEPDEIVETSATFVLLFGVGSAIGPLLAPVVMNVYGDSALFLFTACAQILLVGFTLWRIIVRPAPTGDDKSDFDIYSTAPTGGALTPEPIGADTPMIEVPEWPAAPAGDAEETDREPASATERTER